MTATAVCIPSGTLINGVTANIRCTDFSGKASRDSAIIRTAMCDSKIDSYRL